MLGGCTENLMHITCLDFSDTCTEDRGAIAELKDCVHFRTSAKGEVDSEGPTPSPLFPTPLTFPSFLSASPRETGGPRSALLPGSSFKAGKET